MEQVGLINEAGRIQRNRRPLLQTLKESPLDWLFERNKLPGAILSVLFLASLPISGFLGVPLGTVFIVNWAISLAPTVALTGRLIYHRVVDGHWDPSWWTRPQSHQRQDVAPAPEQPLELELDPDDPTLPFVARKILKFEHWLIKYAERDQKNVRTWLCGQVDDWLNQRARTPGFVVNMSVLGIGWVGAALPTTVIFPIDAVVTGIPSMLGAYLYWRTGDMYRITRPGVHQRPRFVDRVLEKRWVGEPALDLSAPSPVLQETPLAALARQKTMSAAGSSLRPATRDTPQRTIDL